MSTFKFFMVKNEYELETLTGSRPALGHFLSSLLTSRNQRNYSTVMW